MKMAHRGAQAPPGHTTHLALSALVVEKGFNARYAAAETTSSSLIGGAANSGAPR